MHRIAMEIICYAILNDLQPNRCVLSRIRGVYTTVFRGEGVHSLKILLRFQKSQCKHISIYILKIHTIFCYGRYFYKVDNFITWSEDTSYTNRKIIRNISTCYREFISWIQRDLAPALDCGHKLVTNFVNTY